MATIRRRATLALLALACLGAPAQAASPSQSCSKVLLETQPYSISSAAWVDDLRAIAVVDVFRNKVLLYTPTGRAMEAPGLTQSSEFLPSSLLKIEDGFLLKLMGPRLLRLNETLRREDQLDLSKASIPNRKGSVRSFYQWTSVGGDHIVAYGSTGTGDEKNPYQLGFFRTSLGNLYAENLQPLADGDYYVFGFPYLASIGDTAYFLRMEEGKEPALYAVPPGQKPRRLNALPKGYGAPVIRSEMVGPDSAGAVFQEMEGYSLPVGLYAHGRNLYLLTRRKPEGSAATIWSLFQIDPRRDRLGPELRLPTKANHLTVVPGPDRWFLFEKGPVLPSGGHEIKSMLTIPSSWLISPANSPLSAQRLRVKGCS